MGVDQRKPKARRTRSKLQKENTARASAQAKLNAAARQTSTEQTTHPRPPLSDRQNPSQALPPLTLTPLDASGVATKPSRAPPTRDWYQAYINEKRKVARRDRALDKAKREIQHLKHEEIPAIHTAYQQELRRAHKALLDASDAAQKVLKDLGQSREECERFHRLLREQGVRSAVLLKRAAMYRKLARSFQGKLKRNVVSRARALQLARTTELQVRYQESIFKDGMYTIQARALARRLIQAGCGERQVGEMMVEFGRMLGIDMDGWEHKMSARTAERSVLEGGVAADMQLGYEMAKNTGQSSSIPTCQWTYTLGSIDLEYGLHVASAHRVRIAPCCPTAPR